MDIQQMSLLPTMTCGSDAIIEGDYRYQLRRWWDSADSVLVWVLLNPSTADGTKDDATLRRIIYFTRREGYSRLIVVNLFAYRSPSPSSLSERKSEALTIAISTLKVGTIVHILNLK